LRALELSISPATAQPVIQGAWLLLSRGWIPCHRHAARRTAKRQHAEL